MGAGSDFADSDRKSLIIRLAEQNGQGDRSLLRSSDLPLLLELGLQPQTGDQARRDFEYKLLLLELVLREPHAALPLLSRLMDEPSRRLFVLQSLSMALMNDPHAASLPEESEGLLSNLVGDPSLTPAEIEGLIYSLSILPRDAARRQLERMKATTPEQAAVIDEALSRL